jgi:hypothetical protein
MSDGPTPPVQTPVNFLLAGGAGMFSAACVAHLAACGYEPEDFGGFNHVQARINAARDRVTNQGSTDPHDVMLANSTPSHLQMDGLMRRDGMRGNPCGNVVPGHDSNTFPSMPMSRVPGAADGLSNEDRMGMDEREALRRRGLRVGDRVPADAMTADADQRLRNIPGFPATPPATSPTPPTGVPPATPAPGAPGGAPATAGAAAGTPTQPNAPTTAPITGDDAVECINNFRKLGEQRMRQDCVEQREENLRVASPEHAAQVTQNAAAAQTAQTNAQAAHDAANVRAAQMNTRRDDAGGMANLSADDRQEFGAARQAAAQTREELNRATGANNAAQQDLARLPQAQAQARCRVAQADALMNPPVNLDGQVPAGVEGNITLSSGVVLPGQPL